MNIPSLYSLGIGNGQVLGDDEHVELKVFPASDDEYHDAQLSNYHFKQDRSTYPNRPPLQMTVRAFASHPVNELKGTMGFGFWNAPFRPDEKLFRIPRAVWFFFGSPPNNMALAKGVPGYGWKAATFDAARLPFFTLLPFAPLGFLLMRIPALYRLLWPIGQWSLGVAEKELDVNIIEPHTYRLEWHPKNVRFFVDDIQVFHANHSPKGPLGFITWIDNQYAIVTPQGQFKQGIMHIPDEQTLHIQDLDISPL